MKIILNLRMFVGHSITLVKSGGISQAYAKNDNNQSVTSNIDKDTNITLTSNAASGYTFDRYIPIAGLTETALSDPESQGGAKFKMPDNDVSIFVDSIKDNLYAVNEDVMMCVNGKRVFLKQNMVFEVSNKTTGRYEIKFMNGGPTVITKTGMTAAIDNLVKAGVLSRLANKRVY